MPAIDVTVMFASANPVHSPAIVLRISKPPPPQISLHACELVARNIGGSSLQIDASHGPG